MSDSKTSPTSSLSTTPPTNSCRRPKADSAECRDVVHLRRALLYTRSKTKKRTRDSVYKELAAAALGCEPFLQRLNWVIFPGHLVKFTVPRGEATLHSASSSQPRILTAVPCGDNLHVHYEFSLQDFALQIRETFPGAQSKAERVIRFQAHKSTTRASFVSIKFFRRDYHYVASIPLVFRFTTHSTTYKGLQTSPALLRIMEILLDYTQVFTPNFFAMLRRQYENAHTRRTDVPLLVPGLPVPKADVYAAFNAIQSLEGVFGLYRLTQT